MGLLIGIALLGSVIGSAAAWKEEVEGQFVGCLVGFFLGISVGFLAAMIVTAVTSPNQGEHLSLVPFSAYSSTEKVFLAQLQINDLPHYLFYQEKDYKMQEIVIPAGDAVVLYTNINLASVSIYKTVVSFWTIGGIIKPRYEFKLPQGAVIPHLTRPSR